MNAASWKLWFTGLLNAVISGVASGTTASIIGIGWQKALTIAGASALVSVSKWILQHPIPGAPDPSPQGKI